MKTKKPSEISEFVFGTQYYRPPTPPQAEWSLDLEQIKAAGFNTIKIWLMWRWHERERGCFVWDDVDRLFALCARLDLKININLMLDAAPDWLYTDYDAYRYNHRGERVRPIALGAVYIGGVCPCFDNPLVRREAERFIDAAVTRYRNHTALIGWDVWNEPRYLTLSRIGSPGNNDLECWCEHSLQSYRQWLRERFGSIGALNTFLGKAWTSWDSVLPPVRINDYSDTLIWRQWCMFSVTEQIRWVHDYVKERDDRHAACCHVGGCSVIQGAATDPSDDSANSRAVDFYGSSLPVSENNWSAALICDWIRSISPYFWINEIYTGGPHWRNTVTPRDLTGQTWTAVAHGAKGLLYWQFKAERLGDESNGYGLVEIDGSPTDRLKAVSRAARTILSHAALFRSLQPVPAEAAILYDKQSDILSHIESLCGATDYAYKNGLDGLYGLFWQNDIPVDWLVAELLTTEKIRRYKLICLPVPLIVDDAVVAILKDYVHQGGVLLCEASPGLRAANGWVNPAIPPAAMQELFGSRELSRRQTDQPPELTVDWAEREWIFTADRTVSTLSPLTARSIGNWPDGSCAATLNSYGAGQAFLIGTYLGCAYRAGKSEILRDFIWQMALQAGCRIPCQLTGCKEKVSVRCLADRDTKMTVLINHGGQDETLLARMDQAFQREDEASWQVLPGMHGRVTRAENAWQIDLPAGEALCLVSGNAIKTD